MPTAPDQMTENIEFAAQELLEASDGQRTRCWNKWLNRGYCRTIPESEFARFSNRVTAFVNAVRKQVDQSIKKEGF
jgi:hypothetical protein